MQAMLKTEHFRCRVNEPLDLTLKCKFQNILQPVLIDKYLQLTNHVLIFVVFRLQGTGTSIIIALPNSKIG